MAIINIPIPESGLSLEQLADLLAQVIKEIQWLLNGSLDVSNIRANTITADRMNVQQLSAIAADLGTITAGFIYGAFIATAKDTFPRMEFSNTLNLLQALFSATNIIQMAPVYGSNPALIFDNGVARAFLSAILGNMDFRAETGTITIESNDNNIFIFPGSGKNVMFQDWTKPKNQASGHTLQQDLDAKLNGTGISGTVYVSATSGGAATIPITFNNGARTS